jgi:hypothetical protein
LFWNVTPKSTFRRIFGFLSQDISSGSFGSLPWWALGNWKSSFVVHYFPSETGWSM